MDKYSTYCCSNLLNYFDSLYENDTDCTSYADFLLSMQSESKIEDLIKNYDKCLWKFIVNYEAGGKEEFVSDTWYDFNALPDDTKKYWSELNCFLNENIERLFFSQEYSDKFALECITNLRESPNYRTIRNGIFAKSSENVTSLKDKIISSLEIIDLAPRRISNLKTDSNGYIKQKNLYIENIKFLIKKGFIKSIKDITFESKSNISYFSGNYSFLNIVKTVLFIIACLIGGFAILYLLSYAYIGIVIIIAILSIAIKGK